MIERDLDKVDLDRWITGNWGEDQYRPCCRFHESGGPDRSDCNSEVYLEPKDEGPPIYFFCICNHLSDDHYFPDYTEGVGDYCLIPGCECPDYQEENER